MAPESLIVNLQDLANLKGKGAMFLGANRPAYPAA